MQLKTCSICKNIYPLLPEYYYKQKSSKDGFKNICKECIHTTAERHKNDIKKEFKVCRECKKEYPTTTEYFPRYKASKDGLNSVCNICNREKVNQYRKENPEKVKESHQKHYENNKDAYKIKSKKWVENNRERYNTRMKKSHEINRERDNQRTKKWREENNEYMKEYLRDYYQNNKEKHNEYRKANKEKYNKQVLKRHYEKYKKDPKYTLDLNISTAIRQSLKGKKNGHSWESIVGYTLNQLMEHLEKQFRHGMTWSNMGRGGWHIDHIIPKSLFKFTSPEDKKFKECWALDNLQPLWEQDNLSKGNRLYYEEKVI